MPIWNNLTYIARPAYTRSEGKVMVEFKRWAQRFYDAGELARALAETNGRSAQAMEERTS